MPKQLVIDTNLAYDAGRDPSCTKFLNAVLDNEYHVVMEAFIFGEWEKCKSRFASYWRAKMLDKGRFHVINIKPNIRLREDIERFAPDGHCRDEMIKDVPLLETALEKDEIVISLDEEARGYYAFVSISINEIRVIIWVNPIKEEENPVRWLENGADAEPGRQLGHLFDHKKSERESNRQAPLEDLWTAPLIVDSKLSNGI